MSDNTLVIPRRGRVLRYFAADDVSTQRTYDWSATLRIAVAALSLLAIVAISLALVVIAADRPSALSPTTATGYFPTWMAGPLGGLWPQFSHSYTTLKEFVSGSMLGMYACYVLAIVYAPRLRARWTIVAIVAVHVFYFLAPPLSFTDVFNYLNYGRMGVVHHLNPYTTIPVLEPHSDPTYFISNWHHLLSPYGPLFTLFTYALVPLGVPVSFWILKFTLMLASLGAIALVWRCAVMLGRSPVRAAAFLGLNPIVLVWGLGADHNDALMVFFLSLGIYLVLRSQPSRSAAGSGDDAPPPQAVGGWHLPLPGVLVVPPFGGGPGEPARPAGAHSVATAATEAPNGVPSVRRLAPVVAATATGLAGEPSLASPPAAAAVLPPSAAAALNGESAVGHPTARRWRSIDSADWLAVSAGAALVAAVAVKASASVLLPIVLVASRRRLALLAGMAVSALVLGAASLLVFGAHIPDLTTQGRLVSALGLPNLLGMTLGLGGETSGLRSALAFALVIVVCACAWWTWRHDRDWIAAAGAALLMLVVTLSWAAPWYVLWVLPFAALARTRYLPVIVTVVGVYFILAFAPLVTDIQSALHFHPDSTALGRQHTHDIDFMLH